MPAEIPYMASVANVRDIMSKIQSAGTPPKFTHDFLKSNLGFGSSNDRAIIKILKALGFLTADGTPTARYNEYRGPGGGKALATGLREGWDSFFLSDQKVYQKSSGQIQEIAKNVTGAGDAVATKMASTFKVLADLADFSAPVDGKPHKAEKGAPDTQQSRQEKPLPPPLEPDTGSRAQGGILTLSHDIHLHLPPTSDVSVYRAIFQAMKSELM